MNNSLSSSWQWLSTDLRRLAVLISLVLSIWSIFTNDTLNTDGIMYLDVAHQIGNWNWRAASEMYHWNFYPLLIALVSKLTFLELEASAFLFNGLCFAGIAWVFLSILQTLGADKPVLVAGLVLISIHPYINEYRADILRGPGFWLCTLWMLSLLIRILETEKHKYSIMLGAVFIVATLFRIEGTVYLIFAPFILLLPGHSSAAIRLKLFASVYIIPVTGILLLLFAWLILGDSLSVGKLGHPLELIRDAYLALIHKIPEKGEILATQVLNPKSNDFGVVGVIATLAAILFLTVIKRITLFILILAIYAKLKIQIKHMPILLWLSFLNIAYMAVYITHYFFLSSRFAMPVALFLALPASFALARIFQLPNGDTWIKTTTKIISILFISLMLLDGLISTGTSKRYIREAGYWLKDNMQPNELLLTNQSLINHYAGIRMTREDTLKSRAFSTQLNKGIIHEDKLKSADYIAIRLKHIRPPTMNNISRIFGRQSTKVFSSSDKEKIIIYYNER